MDIVLFHSVWTVLLLVLFIAIWLWAWSSKRKDSFDAAARLPLDEDPPAISPQRRPARKGKVHG